MSNDKLKIKEIKTFTEQDMIEFAKWSNRKEDKSKKDLLQLWKEKKPAIKSTSELGCMLDTERPWVELPREINIPNDTRDVEVILKDGTITFGWYFDCWYVRKEHGISRYESKWFADENPDNPVVAWRELEK